MKRNAPTVHLVCSATHRQTPASEVRTLASIALGFTFILISVSYSRRPTCTYVCTVHISRTYSASYTYTTPVYEAQNIQYTITTVAHDHTKNNLSQTFTSFCKA